jgi:hypothetical protein
LAAAGTRALAEELGGHPEEGGAEHQPDGFKLDEAEPGSSRRLTTGPVPASRRPNVASYETRFLKRERLDTGGVCGILPPQHV